MTEKQNAPNMAGNSDAHCPYCGNLIVPKPVRHRKCPQCLQPIRVHRGKLLTLAQEKQLNEERQRELERKETGKRLRLIKLTRDSNLRVLREVKELQRDIPGGFGVEVQAILDDKTCEYCANLDGQIIPADQCRPEGIPPWSQCTSELGCRCYLQTAFGLDMSGGHS